MNDASDAQGAGEGESTLTCSACGGVGPATGFVTRTLAFGDGVSDDVRYACSPVCLKQISENDLAAHEDTIVAHPEARPINELFLRKRT